MGIFSSFFKKENSKEEAKNRLKLVLIQDRAMLPSGAKRKMAHHRAGAVCGAGLRLCR